MASLWHLTSNGLKQFELGDDPMTIGRIEGNSVCLDDRTVSQKHAQIVKDGIGWRVEDLGSSNGTWLNGERFNRHGLSPVHD